MDLKKCLDNLKYDLSNGGIQDETFAMNCYVTMANKACKLLKNGASDEQMRATAGEYLATCSDSGSDTLRCVARG